MSIEPTIKCTWEEFKALCAEYMKNAPTLNAEELDGAFRAVSLGYLGMSEAMWTHSSVIAFRQASLLHEDCVAKLRSAKLRGVA